MRPARAALLLLVLCLGCPPPASASEWLLQCVPFARALSGIRLFGDAQRWWSEAVGRYDRGQTPQPGSILSFRPSPSMPLGHVAVVTRVTGPRRIEMDHANWSSPGEITTSVAAIDVSPGNDWSAVRVELGRSERFGAVYSTDGFIYGRGQGTLGREQPELIYVGRALAAARQPALSGMGSLSRGSVPSTRQALLPWNPVPLAPPMPAFPAQKVAAFPNALSPMLKGRSDGQIR